MLINVTHILAGRATPIAREEASLADLLHGAIVCILDTWGIVRTQYDSLSYGLWLDCNTYPCLEHYYKNQMLADYLRRS